MSAPQHFGLHRKWAYCEEDSQAYDKPSDAALSGITRKLQSHLFFRVVHRGAMQRVAHTHIDNQRDCDDRGKVVVKVRLVTDGLKLERDVLRRSAKDGNRNRIGNPDACGSDLRRKEFCLHDGDPNGRRDPVLTPSQVVAPYC